MNSANIYVYHVYYKRNNTQIHVHLSTKYLAFNKSTTLNIVNVKEHPAISEA